MNMEEIEKSGVSEYYFELIKFIRIFLDYHYPLSKIDFISIMKGEPTLKVQNREKIANFLHAMMYSILESQMEKKNLIYRNNMQDFNANLVVHEEEEKIILKYKQQMLDAIRECFGQFENKMEEQTRGRQLI